VAVLVGGTIIVPVHAKILSTSIYYPKSVKRGEYFTVTVQIVQDDKVGTGGISGSLYLEVKGYSKFFYLTGPTKVKFTFFKNAQGLYVGSASLSFGTRTDKGTGTGSITFQLSACFIVCIKGNVHGVNVQVK